MRPLLPIAAAVLLTAGAAAIPALTQAQSTTTTAKHYKWKKTNIDVAAMSASMSAQNPNAFSPSTASTGPAAEATDQQPGAINAAPKTPVTSDQQTDGTATSDSGVMGNSATTGAQNSPTTPSDDTSMTAPDKSTPPGAVASPQ